MSDAADTRMTPETTPLEERLIRLIKANGPITIADYMADALGHPHDGYYTTRNAIGAEGDFTTAPEITQIFGELVGLWLVQSWIDLGEPAAFNLIELGPGRGVLMADVMRAARLRPDFARTAHLYLVEASGRLRHEQQQRLAAVGSLKLDWLDSFDDAPEGPCLIVANEFFDCLPIRQFVRRDTGWREQLVGLNDDQTGLGFIDAAAPPLPETPLPDAAAVERGCVYEVSEEADTLARTIARRLKDHPGRALIIDYGRLQSGAGDTLQAVRGHAFWPVLASPGRADITAHVDFEAIANAAIETGAGVFGPIPQGAFLENLGLSARLERLCAGKAPKVQAEIHAGAHRVAAPSQMGEIVKALCISAPQLPRPPAF
ncbi:MAG: SAM-dependent methyltransferase [Pseudomonadota bacterium]